MTVTDILLTRHGETQWNTEQRLQGQSDSPLTSEGKRHLPALARRVARFRPEVIVSSDLERAMATARAISAELGLTVQPSSAFRERRFGVFEGLSWEEIRVRYPEAFEAAQRDRWHFTPENGESWDETMRRVCDALEELVASHAGKRIVVVSHGGTVQMIMRHVLGIPNATPRRFEVRNLSYNHIRHRGNEFVVETLGDVSHLTEG